MRSYKVSCKGCETDTINGGFSTGAADACKNYLTAHLPDYMFIAGRLSAYEKDAVLWRFEAVYAGLCKIVWVRELK